MGLRLAKALTVLLAVTQLMSCGLQLGAADPGEPSGNIIGQATFVEQNGFTASGTATLYSQGSNHFVLRLSSMTLPSSTSTLRLNVSVGTNPIDTIVGLTSGAHNYTFTYADGGSFVSVQIFNQPATDVAVATF
ncbi:MAG TPA: hypothetical protein VL588_12030 [Bdellovibrionota bacterium]|jgi:hypothetical protein|nr:hypothetical protein [Bdellovibrionota bacterium]